MESCEVASCLAPPQHDEADSPQFLLKRSRPPKHAPWLHSPFPIPAIKIKDSNGHNTTTNALAIIILRRAHRDTTSWFSPPFLFAPTHDVHLGKCKQLEEHAASQGAREALEFGAARVHQKAPGDGDGSRWRPDRRAGSRSGPHASGIVPARRGMVRRSKRRAAPVTTATKWTESPEARTGATIQHHANRRLVLHEHRPAGQHARDRCSEASACSGPAGGARDLVGGALIINDDCACCRSCCAK